MPYVQASPGPTGGITGDCTAHVVILRAELWTFWRIAFEGDVQALASTLAGWSFSASFASSCRRFQKTEVGHLRSES